MNIAILTFYFAHNYGAMLQAYALKRYIESLTYMVNIVPYIPLRLKQGYSLSPFEKGISIKHRVYNTLFYLKRIRQAKKFESFKKKMISAKEFTDSALVRDFLATCDLVVCGSDQIWNDEFSGKNNVYYGADTDKPLISYAACLGTQSLSSHQKECAAKNLPKFKFVSVRENISRDLLKEYRNDINVVCDPVFLFKPNDWARIEHNPGIKKNYLLLYLLEDNPKLVSEAKKYADIHNLEIYEIHPILAFKHREIKKLRNVGPAEFVYLVHNASAICTNSFHAVSFSILFEKILLHIPNSKSPERTLNILNIAGIEFKNDKVVYDLNGSLKRLNDFIKASKDFLTNALKKA